MSHTIKVSQEQLNIMLDYYSGYLIYNDSPHTIAKAKLEKSVITFYATNTVLFQGVDETNEYNIWANKFNMTQIKTETPNYSVYENMTAIGCDEVGTGDYFGPIVVTATYVRKEDIPFLEELGVGDSKKIDDEKIKKIAPQIAKLIKYKSLILTNFQYISI